MTQNSYYGKYNSFWQSFLIREYRFLGSIPENVGAALVAAYG